MHACTRFACESLFSPRRRHRRAPNTRAKRNSCVASGSIGLILSYSTGSPVILSRILPELAAAAAVPVIYARGTRIHVFHETNSLSPPVFIFSDLAKNLHTANVFATFTRLHGRVFSESEIPGSEFPFSRF